MEPLTSKRFTSTQVVKVIIGFQKCLGKVIMSVQSPAIYPPKFKTAPEKFPSKLESSPPTTIFQG